MSRYIGEEVLSLDIRKEIYEYVLENPGLHLRELSRRLNIPKTTLKYHIRLLVRNRLISLEENGKYNRYFAQDKLGIIDKKFLVIIRQETPRRIIFLAYLYREIQIHEISKALDIPVTTLAYHIQKLKDIGILDVYKQNGKTSYCLNNRKYIYSLIVKYKKTLSTDPIFPSFLSFIKKSLPDGKMPLRSLKEYDESLYEIYNELIKLFPFQI